MPNSQVSLQKPYIFCILLTLSAQGPTDGASRHPRTYATTRATKSIKAVFPQNCAHRERGLRPHTSMGCPSAGIRAFFEARVRTVFAALTADMHNLPNILPGEGTATLRKPLSLHRARFLIIKTLSYTLGRRRGVREFPDAAFSHYRFYAFDAFPFQRFVGFGAVDHRASP